MENTELVKKLRKNGIEIKEQTEIVKQILGQNPKSVDLEYISIYAMDKKLRNTATDKLVAMNPSKQILVEIVSVAKFEDSCKKAFESLMKAKFEIKAIEKKEAKKSEVAIVA